MKCFRCAAHIFYDHQVWQRTSPQFKTFDTKCGNFRPVWNSFSRWQRWKFLGSSSFSINHLRLGSVRTKEAFKHFPLIVSNLNSFKVPTGKRDFFHHQERPVCGQFHYEGLYGGHSTGQKVHLHRKSVFYGIRVRLAWRPRCALLQRHSNGNHAANLWGHCRIQAVCMKWCIQFNFKR